MPSRVSKHQVQAVEGAVALLQRIDHAQRLQIVLEAAMVLHAGVERILARVTEGRMAEVVRERDGLDQVFVQAAGCAQSSARSGRPRGCA